MFDFVIMTTKLLLMPLMKRTATSERQHWTQFEIKIKDKYTHVFYVLSLQPEPLCINYALSCKIDFGEKYTDKNNSFSFVGISLQPWMFHSSEYDLPVCNIVNNNLSSLEPVLTPTPLSSFLPFLVSAVISFPH